ncbi:hypothetical protein [Streptomyces sp. NPDC047315]|uniref:hypothetical protein n=1 Tax=Streptomyces sp. NPDC047315 TaxID=3155142 RepID=UPI0033DA9543
MAALRFEDDTGQLTAPRVNEAARRLCEILDVTAVPMELQDGLLNKWTRWWREKITQGIRYPRHEGPARHTFYDRLYEWAEAAARSGEGDAALTYAGFPSGDQRARLFAVRVVAETSGLLLSHGLPDSLNRLRENMAAEVHLDRTWAQQAAAHRRMTVMARSAGAGLASTLLFDVGFGQDLPGSLTMGGLAVASTAFAEYTSGGFGATTQPMKAARRQVRTWLSTISLWLIQYVTWPDGDSDAAADRARRELRGIVDIVNVLRSGEAVLEPRGDTALIKEHLGSLIDTANRVGDRALETALMNLQTAVLYDPGRVVDPLTELMMLVGGESDAPTPRPGVRPGGLPPGREIPHQPDPRHPMTEPELG